MKEEPPSVSPQVIQLKMANPSQRRNVILNLHWQPPPYPGEEPIDFGQSQSTHRPHYFIHVMARSDYHVAFLPVNVV